MMTFCCRWYILVPDMEKWLCQHSLRLWALGGFYTGMCCVNCPFGQSTELLNGTALHRAHQQFGLSLPRELLPAGTCNGCQNTKIILVAYSLEETAPLLCPPGCRWNFYPREHTKSVNQQQNFLPVQTDKNIETTRHCALGNVNNPLKKSSGCKGTREVTVLCVRCMTHWPVPRDRSPSSSPTARVTAKHSYSQSGVPICQATQWTLVPRL